MARLRCSCISSAVLAGTLSLQESMEFFFSRSTPAWGAVPGRAIGFMAAGLTLKWASIQLWSAVTLGRPRKWSGETDQP